MTSDVKSTRDATDELCFFLPPVDLSGHKNDG